MALSLQDPVFVFTKAQHALDHLGASALAKDVFKALKERMVAAGLQLQFIPFSSDATGDGIIQNTGYSPIGGVASTVYGVYAKNPGAGDGTDSFFALHNAADNASAPLLVEVIQDDYDEVIVVKHDGLVFGTDLTISAATAAGGATESAAANAACGFVIVGA